MFSGNPAGRHLPHTHNPFTRESMDKTWEAAKELLKEQGEDPEELIRKAAEALRTANERGGVK